MNKLTSYEGRVLVETEYLFHIKTTSLEEAKRLFQEGQAEYLGRGPDKRRLLSIMEVKDE